MDTVAGARRGGRHVAHDAKEAAEHGSHQAGNVLRHGAHEVRRVAQRALHPRMSWKLGLVCFLVIMVTFTLAYRAATHKKTRLERMRDAALEIKYKFTGKPGLVHQARDVLEDSVDSLKHFADPVLEKGEDAAAFVRDTSFAAASHLKDGVMGAAEHVKDGVVDAAGFVNDRAEDIGDAAKRAAQASFKIGSKLTDTAEDIGEAALRAASGTAHASYKIGSKVAEHAVKKAVDAAKDLEGTAENLGKDAREKVRKVGKRSDL